MRVMGGPFDFRGRGEWKNWFVQEFSFSHWPVFVFTVKAVQKMFSQIFQFHPPPPLKSQMVCPLVNVEHIVSISARECSLFMCGINLIKRSGI